MRARDILLVVGTTACAIAVAIPVAMALHSAEPTAEERRARADSAINRNTRVVVLHVEGRELPCVVWSERYFGGISCDWSRWGQTPTPAPHQLARRIQRVATQRLIT